MADQGWFDSVYTLATLPAPLSQEHGRIAASSAISLTRGKKRKRSEVAAAIDGEGVYIYNIEDSSLVASYAAPPNTHYDAPSCSLYQKGSKHESSHRLTYATSRSAPSSQAVRLSCYEAVSQETAGSISRPSHQDLPSDAHVLLTDALPTQQFAQEGPVNSHHVLVVQQDGQVSCFASRVSGQLWKTKLSELATSADGFDLPEDFKLTHAEVLSFDAASKGLLSTRQDVLASFNDVNPSSIHFLVVIGSSPSIREPDVVDVDMHVYAIRSTPSRSSAQLAALPQQLISWNIPQVVRRQKSAILRYRLDARVGHLIELVDGKVIMYNLKALSPIVMDSFASRDDPNTLLVLSPTILLTASPTRLSVYDSKFGSILAAHSIPGPTSSGSKKEKQKPLAADPSPLHFIGYFKLSGMVIALRGNELLAIQLGASATSGHKKRSGGLLIDSLARGALNSRLRSTAHNEESATNDQKRIRIGTSSLFSSPEMDALVEANDVDHFEKQFAETVSFNTIAAVDGVAEAGGEVKAPSTSASVQWRFPKISKLHSFSICRPQALYALSKLFTPITTEISTSKDLTGFPQASVRLGFYPENTFLWLVHTGQLRANLIQKALKEYYNFDGSVAHGDVINALANFDGDLSLVHYVLQYHSNLHIDEIVTAVKLIVNSLDNSTLPQPEHKPIMDKEFANAAATTGATTGGVGLEIGPSEPDLPMLDGTQDSKPVQEPEDDIESVTDAAMRDVDELMNQAYETLDKLLPIRGETLRQALTRLNALPQEEVTIALRASLTQHELIFLIHILRVELDQGGWSTRYGDRADLDEADEPSNRAITVIANMLSRAVDAIGMSGWLTASGSVPFDAIDETLSLLRGEISNTLEGVHEATFVSGVLSELLRYQHRLGPTVNAREDYKTREEKMWKEGKTVLVEGLPSARLPMGLETKESQGMVPAIIARTTTSLGGIKTKKIAADLGREIRRNLPPYVFERLRF